MKLILYCKTDGDVPGSIPGKVQEAAAAGRRLNSSNEARLKKMTPQFYKAGSIITFCLLLLCHASYSQYYLRGELKDEQGHALQGARIMLSSKGTYPYYTGSSGAFGIPENVKADTITFILEGYDTLKAPVITSKYGVFTLRMTNRKAISTTLHLSSFTKNRNADYTELTNEDGESYSSAIENSFLETNTFPETSFALNVDRASYSNVRRFLKLKERPPSDAIRIEEMVNYFNLRMKQTQDADKTFSFNTSLTSCPWNSQNQLLFINLQAKKINLDKTPPANLVFLIDVSGSMDVPNRLPLIKNAFKLLVENLRNIDYVSIVTYGDKITILLEPTCGDDKQKIIESIEGLKPAGFTPGASAIRTAYNVAKNNFIQDGNNRVILATDGDFNIGQTSDKDLENLISQESKTGIYLTCLGVGIGNYKDSKLEALATKGNGNFAYLDNEKEAEKVLVEEFSQTLYSVANNAYLTVSFNSNVVKEYRLIGFDNKKSAVADKNTELEGGEIGSGHSLLTAFEITRVNTNDTTANNGKMNVATIQLSYKNPGSNEVIKEQYQAPDNYMALNEADSCLRFAAAVIMFGTLLKQSPYAKDYSWDNLHSLAATGASSKNLLQTEFVDLTVKAKKLYSSLKKKKS